MEQRDTVQFTRGVNLRSMTGSLTMQQGEASDAVDVLPREDGAIYTHFGWLRINDSALTGRPVGCYGFSYRGKNNDTGSGNTARPGNFALADDGAAFTRRADEFSGFIVLTTSTFYRFEPDGQTFQSVALPAGVSVLTDAKPVFLTLKENVYIVGWTDANLRYDPTDETLYVWGWDETPVAPTQALQAGGTLQAGKTYKYAVAFLDLYTGEESSLGAEVEATPTSANATVRVTMPAVYGGSRHFNDLAVGTDSDVAFVLYRTFANGDTFYFLSVINPGTTTFDDDADENITTDDDVRPFEETQVDAPLLFSIEEFNGRMFGLATGNRTRLYFSDLNFFERWRSRGYKELPVSEGNNLTALGRTDTTLLAHGRRGAFRNAVLEQGGASPQIIVKKLPFEAGAVGPRARFMRGGYEYWLSEIGPMRWREGLLKPQWIGKPISPLFVDATSQLCRLSEKAMQLSEVGFDWISKTVRFLFAIDGATYPNQNWCYWTDADLRNGDPESGWFPHSPRSQCMDLSHSLDKLDENGKPVTAADRGERLVFADNDGYVYEVDIASHRAGLKRGALAKTFAAANSTVSSLEVDGGLYTNGDGLTGLRVEVVHANGTRESRKIESNTDTAIVPTEDFDTAAAEDDIVWIGGIPSFWRSWVDHFGLPQNPKTVMHLDLGYMALGPDTSTATELGDWVLDIRVQSGEFPETYKRTTTKALSQYRSKMAVSATARLFTYEIANFRPDEGFVLTELHVDYSPVAARRRA